MEPALPSPRRIRTSLIPCGYAGSPPFRMSLIRGNILDMGSVRRVFPRPFLDQVRRSHDQSRKRPARAMHQHASQSDQGLARTAVATTFALRANCHRLLTPIIATCSGWVRSTEHPGKQRRRGFVGAMQGWI